MHLGIFAKTFPRGTLTETLDAVVNHGLNWVQFNMVCVGLDSMPDEIDSSVIHYIKTQMESRDINIAAVSGTFNMIVPDEKKRTDGLRRLRELAGNCRDFGVEVITLCTGSRDSEDKWRWHPDNDSKAAWKDLVHSMEVALCIADEYDVVLAIEPEVTNVISSPIKARQLLDEMKSSYLKVVIDGSNIFSAGDLERMHEVLDKAFEYIHDDIVIAHAKDLTRDGEAGNVPAGQGLLDYDHYIELLIRYGFDGPIILHGLEESQVTESIAFMRDKLGIRAGFDM